MWRKFLLLIIILSIAGCMSRQNEIDAAISGTLTAVSTNTPIKTNTPTLLPTSTYVPTSTPPARRALTDNNILRVVKELERQGFIFTYFEYEAGRSRYIGYYGNNTNVSIVLDMRFDNFVGADYSLNYQLNNDENVPDFTVLDIAVFGKEVNEDILKPWRKIRDLLAQSNILCFNNYVIFDINTEELGLSHSISLDQDWEVDMKPIFGGCP